MNRWIIAFGLLLALMLAVDASMASNSTWDKAREKKARIVKKLKKDFRKLKKQDGAVKLVGGESSHEGKGIECFTSTLGFSREIPVAIGR